MESKTQEMIVRIGGPILRKVLMLQSTALVSHGLLADNNTEVFVSLGMATAGAAWSFWNDYGRDIVQSQFEVWKAKSLAQAEKIRSAGLPPVTMAQIADQSPKLTVDDVKKAVAAMPPAAQANVAKEA